MCLILSDIVPSTMTLLNCQQRAYMERGHVGGQRAAHSGGMPPAFTCVKGLLGASALQVGVLQVEEQTPLTASEVYLFTWRGHLCFLPGLPWLALGRWHLPKQQMDALATCVRRVARLLWSVHVSFMDGFDEVKRPASSRHQGSGCPDWLWGTLAS